MNVYAGYPAFKPNYIQGDVLTKFDRLGRYPSLIQGQSPGNVYDPMRGINYPIPGQVTNPGDGYIAALNQRATQVRGPTPQAPMAQPTGYGFGTPGVSDILKRLLQARGGTY